LSFDKFDKMDKKSKGSNAERELIHMFWDTGEWGAVRAAGSGSVPLPCPDIVAGNRLRTLAIECKASGELRKYIKKKQIEELRQFSLLFGAEPWLGIRFDSEKWLFLGLDDLKETPLGYSVSLEMAKSKGLLFEQLIS